MDSRPRRPAVLTGLGLLTAATVLAGFLLHAIADTQRTPPYEGPWGRQLATDPSPRGP